MSQDINLLIAEFDGFLNSIRCFLGYVRTFMVWIQETDDINKTINEYISDIESNGSKHLNNSEFYLTVPDLAGSSDRRMQEPVTETLDVPESICSEYINDADLVELIDEFVAGLEGDIRAMRKALESGDYDGLRRLAHQMKGAGGSYGYPMLTKAAKIIEAVAKAKDVETGKTALDKLESLCLAAYRGRKTSIKI